MSLLGLTWSLMPVAMWPTFTRRASLIRMLCLLKSLMQTSTPKKRGSGCHKAFYTFYCIILKLYWTFKTARWGLLCLVQQIHAENLHICLTAAGKDTRAEVICEAEGPTAGVLPEREKDKTGLLQAGTGEMEVKTSLQSIRTHLDCLQCWNELTNRTSAFIQRWIFFDHAALLPFRPHEIDPITSQNHRSKW